MSRHRGSVLQRGPDTWRITVDLEPDTATGERQRKTETFHGLKKEAEKRLTVLLGQLDQGMLRPDPKLTVNAYLERWLTDYSAGKAPKTHHRYQEIVRNWLVPHIGNVQLGKLTPSHVARLVTTLRQTPCKTRPDANLSAQSVKHALRCLHVALACAVKWQLIPRNPADDIDAPTAPRKEMRTFTVEQAQAFLSGCEAEGTKWVAFFTTAMTTGLRLGELIGLRWIDADLDAGVARVQQNIQRVNGIGLVVKAPKTAGSRRPVAIGGDVVALLRRHRSEQNVTRLRLGLLWQDQGLVFPSERGTPLCDKSIRAVFGRVCSQANVPVIRLYDLRHTAASLLLASGVHPKVVAERLGHSTVNLTLNTYSHVLPGLQQDAADTLDRLLRKSQA